jgi:hypothetical protein
MGSESKKKRVAANLNFVALAFEQIPSRARDVAAKRLKALAFDVQALDVGVLDIPDAGFIIVSGFDHGDAHFPIPWPEPAT